MSGDAKGILVAIAALVLWILTVTVGISVLVAGNRARHLVADPAPPITLPRSAAPPVTEAGGPPPIPRTKVHATPGEHPLLEFLHPALGAVGLACWFLFVGLHYRPLAWVSLGIVVVVVAAGLGWLASNTLAARGGGSAARAPFPPRLIMLHGLAATVTVLLAVLTAVSASRG
jgi:hypothetical protein